MGRLSPANQKEGASSSSSGAVAANALVQKNTPKYPTAPLRSKPNFFGASTLEEELEEIEIDLTRRCGLRMLQAECKRDTLSGLFASQLVRIPKKIQEMKVREFALKYGGSMSSVLEHERKKVAGLLHNQNRNDENEITGTALKKSATKARSRIHQVASARTLRKQEPKINNIVPSTPVTKPNFSVPGSSVIAKRTPHGGVSTPTITLAIGSAEKRMIHFTDASALQLQGKDKESAVTQLEKLQQKVASFLQALNR